MTLELWVEVFWVYKSDHYVILHVYFLHRFCLSRIDCHQLKGYILLSSKEKGFPSKTFSKLFLECHWVTNSFYFFSFWDYIIITSLKNNHKIAPEARGTLQKRGQKDYRSQRIRAFVLTQMSQTIPIKFHQHDCLSMSRKVTATVHMSGGQGNPLRAHAYKKNYTRAWNEKMGEKAFPRKSTPIDYLIPNRHPGKHTYK